MAIGALMLSIPAALLASCLMHLRHNLGPLETLVTYSAFGMLFLLAILLVNGLTDPDT